MNHVRRATPADAEQIAAILRAEIPKIHAGLVDRTIYFCAGYARYLRDVIQCYDRGGRALFLVYDLNGAIAGFAELCGSGHSLFANSLFVLPPFRDRFINCKLLVKGVEPYATMADGAVIFDVFESNTRVLKWYTGLGARPVESTLWLEALLSDHEAPRPAQCHVSDLPQADVTYQHYGFSTFRLTTSRKSYAIGQLGLKYFRSTDGDILTDADALVMLRRIDPARALLCIIPAEVRPPAGACAVQTVEIARTQRLELAAGELHRKLLPFCHA